MIKLHKNLFIGADVDKNSNFTLDGSDSKENYIKNLDQQPSNWIYRNKDITYSRNSFGHRSKEIDTLDDEFILFTGCSISFGSGLALEDTFAFNVAKSLQLDYYNMAVEASGIDTLSHNIYSWFKNIKKKPKFVVLQWPETHRFFYPSTDPKLLLGPWVSYIKKYYTKEINSMYDTVISTEVLEHFYKILKMSLTTTLDVLEIPYYEFNLPAEDIVDYARDLKHPGIITNEIIAKRIIVALKS